jgi:hypothetical protein
VLPDFCAASVTKCCRIFQGECCIFLPLSLHFGNEVLPDFSKASAAPFCRSAFIFDNEVLPDFPKLTEQ